MFGMTIFLPSCSELVSKGDVVFWTDESTKIITVTFRDSDKRITKYYYSTPDCGDSGCATFNDVPTGTYKYHAENLYYYWDGRVTVEEDECSQMLLYVSKAVKKSEPSGDNTPLECFEDESCEE